MFIVIVKGSVKDAHRAAANRAIPLRVVGTIGSSGHVGCRVSDQHEHKLVRWFCAEAGTSAPFPPGSLLFYNHKLR